MIHAMEGAPVSEVTLSPWWRRHLAAAFRFPQMSDPPGLTPYTFTTPFKLVQDLFTEVERLVREEGAP
jgi:hypothetical protein